ncbi:KAP family P-loop NTPase fold protein [Tenacibaculum sp. SDUM215027]|uniref:KAP family P-loop NTPase fold protein n=1 Tax=Tenacibaculum sp. SDUM215027 TaxID=3422596 RepID=UPI003D31D61F
MWSDNDTEIDFLDFSYLIQGTKNIIYNDELLPCTIGIYGDWGGGKSSLMRMIEADIKEDKGILSIKFNGWLFEGYDDAKSVLLTTIVEKIISNQKLNSKAKNLAKKLFHQIDWMKLAKKASAHGLAYLATGGIGNAMLLAKEGIDFSGTELGETIKDINFDNYDAVVESIEDTTKQGKKLLTRGIRDFHQDLGKLIKESKYEKIVVFIDDLDRCTSDTIISTLEAIKLFLYAENSIFVISAYEKLINYAVRKRFPEIPGEAKEVGRDYLEKLIQFPIRIPQMNTLEIETYINLLFTKLYLEDDGHFFTLLDNLKKNEQGTINSSSLTHKNISNYLETVPSELNNALILSSQITPILTNGLNGNPRQCKRFLNMLLMRKEMAKNKNIDLKIRLLAKVMLLEYFRPEHFTSLSEINTGDKEKKTKFDSFEKEFIKNSESIKESTSNEFESWSNDPWLENWLKIEPSLNSEDLIPYFFFSRDNLRAQPIQAQRLSPQAQEIFMLLVSGSKAKLSKGIQEMIKLGQGDSANILSAISDKIRSSDTKSIINNLLTTQCKICEVKTELISEYFEFLQRLPEGKIPIQLVPALKGLINSNQNQSQQFQNLLSKWSKGENKMLISAIKEYL